MKLLMTELRACGLCVGPPREPPHAYPMAYSLRALCTLIKHLINKHLFVLFQLMPYMKNASSIRTLQYIMSHNVYYKGKIRSCLFFFKVIYMYFKVSQASYKN